MSAAYLLAVVSFQPVHTSFSNIFGRKPALHFCCCLFCVGLLIFGTSSSPQVLILGRMIQGLGGGGLEDLSEVILTDITTLEERPRYLGLMAFSWACAGVVGPAIGGALVQIRVVALACMGCFLSCPGCLGARFTRCPS
jgi:MFS family permease